MFTDAQRLQEEELLFKIAEVEREQKHARIRIGECNKALTDAEGVLIEIKLSHDRLIEQLRMWRSKNVDSARTTDREEDIARFLKILPDLDPETWEILLAQKEKK